MMWASEVVNGTVMMTNYTLCYNDSSVTWFLVGAVSGVVFCIMLKFIGTIIYDMRRDP